MRKTKPAIVVLLLAVSCSSKSSGITASVQCDPINQQVPTPPPHTTMDAVVTVTSQSDVPSVLVLVQMVDEGKVVATTRGVAADLQARTPVTVHMPFKGPVPHGGWPDPPVCQASAQPYVRPSEG